MESSVYPCRFFDGRFFRSIGTLEESMDLNSQIDRLRIEAFGTEAGDPEGSSALSKLKSGVSILLAIRYCPGKRKLEAYATENANPNFSL